MCLKCHCAKFRLPAFRIGWRCRVRKVMREASHEFKTHEDHTPAFRRQPPGSTFSHHPPIGSLLPLNLSFALHDHSPNTNFQGPAFNLQPTATRPHFRSWSLTLPSASSQPWTSNFAQLPSNAYLPNQSTYILGA